MGSPSPSFRDSTIHHCHWNIWKFSNFRQTLVLSLMLLHASGVYATHSRTNTSIACSSEVNSTLVTICANPVNDVVNKSDNYGDVVATTSEEVSANAEDEAMVETETEDPEEDADDGDAIEGVFGSNAGSTRQQWGGGEAGGAKRNRVYRLCGCWNTTEDSGYVTEVECKCKGTQLKAIPQNLSHNVNRITVTDAGIERIDGNSLQRYRATLTDFVLNDVKSLRSLHSNTFQGLRHLERIYIRNAPMLKALPPDIFNVILPELKIIQIVRTGLIEFPSLAQLATGSILHTVDFESNHIHAIPSYSVRIRAAQFILDYNAITKVENYAFNGSEIAKLSLKGNRVLSQLEPDAFVGLKSLRTLDLSETSISDLPTRGLTDLEVLRLQDTESLKVFPSVYNFQSIREAWLTYPYHCCAFEFPATHDPQQHARYHKFREDMKKYCSSSGEGEVPSSSSSDSAVPIIPWTQHPVDFIHPTSARSSGPNFQVDYDELWHKTRVGVELNSWAAISGESSSQRQPRRKKKRGVAGSYRPNLSWSTIPTSTTTSVTLVISSASFLLDDSIEHHEHDFTLPDGPTNSVFDQSPFEQNGLGFNGEFAPDYEVDIARTGIREGDKPSGRTLGEGDEEEDDSFSGLGVFHPSTISRPQLVQAYCGNLTKLYRDVQCFPQPDAFSTFTPPTACRDEDQGGDQSSDPHFVNSGQENSICPCEDIMGTIWLRIAVWLVAVAAVVGNLAVMVVLLSSRFRMTVSKLLMVNLAAADLCMGLYLLLIAAMDLHTIGVYFNYAIDWQRGAGCKISGFLTVFASELSIFTLVVITCERWYTITYAIHLNRRLRLSTAAKVMAIGWTYALTMATLPILDISSFAKTSICLPLETRDVGDTVYLLVLLITNAVAFLMICLCYGHMYHSISGHNAALASHSDATVAKRMALLVFTDFACWAPIAFFGLTAMAGFPLINVTHSKILLVFFYPLNACTNPYLYALLTKQYRRDLFLLLGRYGFCTQRAARYKAVFSVGWNVTKRPGSQSGALHRGSGHTIGSSVENYKTFKRKSSSTDSTRTMLNSPNHRKASDSLICTPQPDSYVELIPVPVGSNSSSTGETRFISLRRCAPNGGNSAGGIELDRCRSLLEPAPRRLSMVRETSQTSTSEHTLDEQIMVPSTSDLANTATPTSLRVNQNNAAIMNNAKRITSGSPHPVKNWQTRGNNHTTYAQRKNHKRAISLKD